MDQIEDVNAYPTQRPAKQADADSNLKQTIKELETVCCKVSHDLRTPLNNILLCAQAVLRHCGHNLDEQCQTYLMSIFSQTEHMNQLITGMTEFSHASCMEIHKERVDLSGIADKITSNLKLKDTRRSVKFTIKPGIKVNGDTCLLQMVLDNLIGNAWKYTGLKESPSIEFGVTRHNGKPAYFVRDNGIGFEMNQAAALFGIFQRLQCKDEFTGYGIGLATVRQIIQRHGGEVWAEGKVGKGATFYFTL